MFVDESGIHKKDGRSVFVAVCIVLDNVQELEEIILSVEKRLKIQKFHWSEAAWPVRREFLETVFSLNFVAIIGIIRNPISSDEGVESVLPDLLRGIDIEKLFIDGKKPRAYVASVKKLLRDKGLSTKKLRMVKDDGYPGVRVADALAGVTRAALDGKIKADIWFEKLKKRKSVTFIEAEK